MKTMKKIFAISLTLLMLALSSSFIGMNVYAMNIPEGAVEFQEHHYYKVFDQGMTWNDAKEFCENYEGHLATITSEEEQRFVEGLISESEKNFYWLGGERITSNRFDYVWITDEAWSYSNWGWHLPDNWTSKEEDKLMIYAQPYSGRSSGEWNDLNADGTCENENEYFGLNHCGFICEWEDIYNLGDETYNFENYVDNDSATGHCFGMSITSSGYYNSYLDISLIGDSKVLYDYSDSSTVKTPICYYQARQGSIANNAIVAGGYHYTRGFGEILFGAKYDIESDWEEVIGYVRNHSFDNKGTLQIGFRKDGQGGHAVNFLRYAKVNGQDRIYAYDNNYPDDEVYFYMDSLGQVFERPYECQTFSGRLDCIALRDVATYYSLAGSLDLNRVIYAANNAISVVNGTAYPMDGNIELGEHVMIELPDDLAEVKITPLVENASFIYKGQTYKFDKINEETFAILTIAKEETDTGTFVIENAPDIEPTEPMTEPTTNPSTEPSTQGRHADEGPAQKLNFFQRIIQWFRNLFAKLFGK